jgi:ribosomal protein L13
MLSRLKLYAGSEHPHEAQVKSRAGVERGASPDTAEGKES